MASSSGASVFSRITGVVSKYIRAPWKYTGPVSGPEFLESVPEAGKYRPFAPTNPPYAASIPASELDRVFNIKYHDRERRRLNYERKEEAKTVAELRDELLIAAAGGPPPTPEPTGEGEATPAPVAVPSPESVAYIPPPMPGTWYRPGYEVHLNDAPGDGYQK